MQMHTFVVPVVAQHWFERRHCEIQLQSLELFVLYAAGVAFTGCLDLTD